MSKDSSNAQSSRGSYWDSYYARQRPLKAQIPSQFCVFVAGELHQPYRVFDVGCGGGRDSIFFATQGHEVTGIDGSESAIAVCERAADDAGVRASFIRARVSEFQSVPSLPNGDLPSLVYARFFLHAITDEEETEFLALARRLGEQAGLLAVEFRTSRDAELAKVTDAHYRRFVDPLQFMSRATSVGFTTRYFVEGFGYAKYKQDDAHVARFIFDRSGT